MLTDGGSTERSSSSVGRSEIPSYDVSALSIDEE